MVDSLTPEERSRHMARIRDRDTQPELQVRRVAHAMGLRYRLYRRDLPGTPDLVFPRWRRAVFVHGCFWHRHLGCSKTTTPKTRADFWEEKFRANQARDARKFAGLQAAGWRPVVIWECETRDAEALSRIIAMRVIPTPF